MAKEKFANLRKKFIFLFLFVSYLYLVYLIYFFYFLFFFKVLSIMTDKEMNELLYTLHNQFSSHTSQRESTWEDIVVMEAQTSMGLHAFNFEGVNYSNNNAGYFSKPQNVMPSYYHSGWGTFENFSYGHPSM